MPTPTSPTAPRAAPWTAPWSDFDTHLFREGTHVRLYDKLGCQLRDDGRASFAVWAPNAAAVAVVGDWNGWDEAATPMTARSDGSGIWEAEAEGVPPGAAYKYRLRSNAAGAPFDKADPIAFSAEEPSRTASRTVALTYEWHDADWMASRRAKNAHDAPMSIYEFHPGSWRRIAGRFMTYGELAPALADHVISLGFTHVELMPITEHPFYGSWGYQTTGYFAPTARYGSPTDFMAFVDHLHQRGLGVLLDWVPSHFPTDAHGLATFDGTHLYEHADPRQGFHPEWNSAIFNYGRNEVRSFLLSSALFWLDKYHCDGLRVDGVASMLYLDYSRKAGEWIPNRNGGRENLEAVALLQALNVASYREFPDTVTVAEESTAWPLVSRPVHGGGLGDGLGFGMKWNMGWMHDTLAYLKQDPVNRKYHHGQLTFSIVYAFNENFVLPLSHDEVVYGKGSLIGKMPGDTWQQFANLRALYGYMWAHPGKKLLFMGGEIAQRREWNHDGELDWEGAARPENTGIQRWLGELNRVLREEPALHQLDFSPDGFQWVEGGDAEASVIVFLRRGREAGDTLVVACNFTPLPRENYLVGVPAAGRWREVVNSDAAWYGGAGWGNLGGADASPLPWRGQPFSLNLTLPPLATLILKLDGAAR